MSKQKVMDDLGSFRVHQCISLNLAIRVGSGVSRQLADQPIRGHGRQDSFFGSGLRI